MVGVCWSFTGLFGSKGILGIWDVGFRVQGFLDATSDVRRDLYSDIKPLFPQGL